MTRDERKREQAKAYRHRNRAAILERTRQRYAANRAAINTRRHERQSNSPVWVKKHLIRHAKARAARFSVPFALSPTDIELPRVCPVLGLLIDYSYGSKGVGPKPRSPSLDRLDPKRGYVTGNVQVISFRANQIKGDASPTELVQVAAYYGMFG